MGHQPSVVVGIETQTSVVDILLLIIIIIMITSVVDMARESDVFSNLDPEVLRLRVEIRRAL